jgi:hypothetical protein
LNVFEGKYFVAKLLEEKPRTAVYGIYSKHHGDLLSKVAWYAPWRQYCNFTEPNTVWTRSCNVEVNAFIDQLTEARKK